MLIGYFDYAIIIGLLYINYKYWKRQIRWLPGCLLVLVVFGIVLPIFSILAELQVNGPKPGEIHDNFNFVYVYLRFPLYWGLLVLQSLVLLLKTKVDICSPLKKMTVLTSLYQILS